MKTLAFALAVTCTVAVLLYAAPAPADPPVNTGCSVGQGPDEWLPGVATTVLPSSGSAGEPRVMTGRKTIAVSLPAAAAGNCWATFDAATLTSTGARGFPIERGAGWTTIDIGAQAPLRMVCTAQLVTPNGAKVFQCR